MGFQGIGLLMVLVLLEGAMAQYTCSRTSITVTDVIMLNLMVLSVYMERMEGDYMFI